MEGSEEWLERRDRRCNERILERSLGEDARQDACPSRICVLRWRQEVQAAYQDGGDAVTMSVVRPPMPTRLRTYSNRQPNANKMRALFESFI